MLYVIRFTRSDITDVIYSVVLYDNDQNPDVFYTRSNKVSIFSFEEMQKHVKEITDLYPNATVKIYELESPVVRGKQ